MTPHSKTANHIVYGNVYFWFFYLRFLCFGSIVSVTRRFDWRLVVPRLLTRSLKSFGTFVFILNFGVEVWWEGERRSGRAIGLGIQGTGHEIL